MSLDRSLKASGGLAKHRNVLTRAERIAKLSGLSKFDSKTGSPLGLPKVGNRKVKAVKTVKKDAAATPAEGAAGAAAPAAAAAAPAAEKKGGKK